MSGELSPESHYFLYIFKLICSASISVSRKYFLANYIDKIRKRTRCWRMCIKLRTKSLMRKTLNLELNDWSFLYGILIVFLKQNSNQLWFGYCIDFLLIFFLMYWFIVNWISFFFLIIHRSMPPMFNFIFC